MKAIDRYLLREISAPFMVGMGLFFVIIAFGQLLKISDSVTGLGITGGEVFQALLYSFPPLIGILIPVSLLFATMLGVGRMASDREIVALCAAGISPFRLLKVPVLVACVLSLVAGFATVVGEPWGVRGLRDLMSRSAQRALASGIRVDEFHEWVPGVTFLTEERRGDDLINIFFADRRDKENPIVVSAHQGRVYGGSRARDLVFELFDGTIWVTGGAQRSHRMIHFEKMRYRLDVKRLVGNKAKTLTSAQAKSLEQLWSGMHNAAKAKRRALYAVTLHRKAAIPVATIIFGMLAVPLACNRKPGARARGFLYSSGLVGAYYYIGRAAELQARNADFSPILAAWLPDILGLIAVMALLYRLRRRGL